MLSARHYGYYITVYSLALKFRNKLFPAPELIPMFSYLTGKIKMKYEEHLSCAKKNTAFQDNRLKVESTLETLSLSTLYIC